MLKNYIIGDNGLMCHYGFKLLPKGFLAITLFGHIFFRKNEEDLKDYLKTERGQITMNHERIHVLQAETFKTKYFGFYIVYLWYWFINCFKYGLKESKAYYNNPFEIEAYDNQLDFDYKETNWKRYKNCQIA